MRRSKIILEIGQRFGRLTVLRQYSVHGDRRTLYACRCACGQEKIIHAYALVKGFTQSCGCLSKELKANRLRTHGKTNTTEYEIWCGIKKRCLNPNYREFHLYGGRGIQICPHWKDSFTAFLGDMGPRPSLRHSIDRVDNNGNYEPGNCRWATPQEQSDNSSNPVFITWDGRTQNASAWAKEFGTASHTIVVRYTAGKPLDKRVRRWGKKP
jgi:hypothetical protein